MQVTRNMRAFLFFCSFSFFHIFFSLLSAIILWALFHTLPGGGDGPFAFGRSRASNPAERGRGRDVGAGLPRGRGESALEDRVCGFDHGGVVWRCAAVAGVKWIQRREGGNVPEPSSVLGLASF